MTPIVRQAADELINRHGPYSIEYMWNRIRTLEADHEYGAADNAYQLLAEVERRLNDIEADKGEHIIHK